MVKKTEPTPQVGNFPRSTTIAAQSLGISLQISTATSDQGEALLHLQSTEYRPSRACIAYRHSFKHPIRSRPTISNGSSPLRLINLRIVASASAHLRSFTRNENIISIRHLQNSGPALCTKTRYHRRALQIYNETYPSLHPLQHPFPTHSSYLLSTSRTLMFNSRSSNQHDKTTTSPSTADTQIHLRPCAIQRHHNHSKSPPEPCLAISISEIVLVLG